MAYTITGTYVADCDCNLVCPCPYDGPPTGKDNQCHGAVIFHVDRGNLDDVDLSGVNWAFYNHFPDHLTAGKWKVGITVDTGASDEQAQAIERIASGQAGGPFAEFAPLIGEYAGMKRGKVTYSDGDKASGSIEGVGDVSIDPFMGPDGKPTRVRNAMVGFAPEYTIGRSSGQATVLGTTTEFKYAESAQFEYTSEGEGQTVRA
jgi:hypothetical protein